MIPDSPEEYSRLELCRTKYLGINLTKEVKDLYSKNYTTLKKKKLRKIQTNGSMYHVHGLEELTSSKWPYYPKRFIDSVQSLRILSNVEKEEQSRSDHNTWYQTVLQGYCNQNSLVVA